LVESSADGKFASLSTDDAYLAAKVLFEQARMPGRLDAVVELLRHARTARGPSRYRPLAQQWLTILSGGS
jgi:hypothetical protein